MPTRRRDQDLLDRVGARLQRLRLARGFTQRALAEAIDMEPESISRVETGAISLSLSNLVAVARVLQVSVNDLVAFDEAPPPPATPLDVAELLRLYTALEPGARALALGAMRGIAKAAAG